MNITSAQKFFITAAVFALIIAASALAYAWIYQRIRTLADESDALDVKIISQHKEQQRTGSVDAILRNHQADLGRLRAFSIDRNSPAPFFQEFEALAARTRTTMTISINDAGANAHTMALRFTIDGSEKNVAAMLALLERAPYELTVDDLSIQRTESDNAVSATAPQAGIIPSQVHLVVNVHIKTI